MPEFLARYPKLTVDLLLLDRIVNLVEEGFDVAIQPGPLEASTLIARKLGAFRRVVCAAPSYLQRRGEPMQPQELKNHDCIVFTLLESAQEWSFRTEAGDIKVPVSGRLRVNNHAATVMAALGGAGLVLGPSWMVRDHILAGRLIPVLQGFELPTTEVHALFPHLRLMSSKVRAFTDFLVERCVIEELGRPLPT